MQAIPITEATAGDREEVAASLAAAFQEDPIMVFLFPNPATRRQRLPGVFVLLFNEDTASGTCLITPAAEAATLWQPPGYSPEPLLQKLASGWRWLPATRSAILRALAFSTASDANRPATPHAYLHVAGCAPAAQGRGLGRALIRAGLERAAEAGVPTYLETATPRNIGYYQSFGFTVIGEWTVAHTLTCWSMLRLPSSA